MRGSGNMWITMTGVLVAFAGGIMIWFRIPFSPVKRRFRKDISMLLSENQGLTESGIFTKEDFSHLPAAIRRYVEHCGYIGTPKMSCLKMKYHDVAFWQTRNGPVLSIDYLQYNFVKKPCRMALIDSSLFGIPFEGYGPQSAVIIGFLKTESDSRQNFRLSGNIPTGTSSILMGESVKYPMAEKTVFQNFYFQENMIWRAPFLVFFRQLCYSE